MAINPIEKMNNNYIGYFDTVSDYGINTLTNKIKHIFGHEFFISHNMVRNGKHFKEFLQMCIPDIDVKYYSKENEDYIPFVDFRKIDKDTFVYIATGRYIPGKLFNAMINDDNNIGMYLYVFGKKSPKYTKEVKEIMEKDRIANSTNSIYVVNKAGDGYDIVSMGFDARDIDTLVYSHGETDTIVKHLDKFIDSIDFYKSKSIIYKTGILLYGEPGTGKSSIVKTLASKYGRNICQVNVASLKDIDFNILKIMIEQDDEKYIVLFEDIDTIYLNREDATATDANEYNNIINKLLQFLDSNTSPTDVIFIATTNHIERLDKAITREGRFDLKINVKGLLKNDVKKFMDLLECKYSEDFVFEKYGEVPQNADGEIL